MIPISEIYTAVQGEGIYKTPAIFIRVWGCNLRCGFRKRGDGKTVCDTPYAVFEGNKKHMSVKEIIYKLYNYDIKHIVFTGGEPLLYQKYITKIALELSSDYFIEIETNGSIKPTLELIENIDWFNISVKLKSSNQWKDFDEKRINKEALNAFPIEKSIYKFVISSNNDIDEIKKIQEINPISVYLMPKGETREEVIKNLPITLDMCMHYNFGFTNRDHIIAYDNKRGV